MKINGQWYEKTAIDYMKSQPKPLEERKVSSPKSLTRIKSDTVSSAGFQKKRTVEEPKSERLQQQDRLALLQLERNRLADILKKKEQVISHITKWLADN